MRHPVATVLVVALFATLLVPGAVVAAPDASAVRLPWDGFGEGSTVHIRITSQVAFPGAPTSSTEQRQTLVKITPEHYVVKHETKVGEQWMGSEMNYPRKVTGPTTVPDSAVKPEDLGTEAVTVEGKEYLCKKQQVIVAGMTTVMWTHDKEGLLRTDSRGPGSETSRVVTRLSFKTTVAGKELDVRETTTTAKAMGSATTIKSWESRGVPGGAVRTEMVTEMSGMKTTSVSEVIAFEAK